MRWGSAIGCSRKSSATQVTRVRCADAVSDELTPAQRTLRAKLGAHASWAQTTNRTARTEAARKAAKNRFRRLADPEGVLPAEVVDQRAAALEREHYTRMAYLSAKSRRRGGR